MFVKYLKILFPKVKNCSLLLLCLITHDVTLGQSLDQADLREKRMEELSVMIEAKYQDNNPTDTWAGIIVGVVNDTIFIATTNHTVRDYRNSKSNLFVEFGVQKNKLYGASLFDKWDFKLDLAIIGVIDWKKDGIPVEKIPFNIFGNSDRIERRSEVYHIGYLGDSSNKWGKNINPAKVTKNSEGVISFESLFLNTGNSGGGLFDSEGYLIGMVKLDVPPYGKAVSLNNLKQKLRNWRLPIGNTPILRSKPDSTLTKEKYKRIVQLKNLFDASANPKGLDYSNQFEIINDIVVDHGSRLIWKRSGSVIYSINAANYLFRLNYHRFSEFQDWRLPTVEEAISLITFVEKDTFVEPVFVKHQSFIWTSDRGPAPKPKGQKSRVSGLRLESTTSVEDDSTVDINESNAFPQTGFHESDPFEFPRISDSPIFGLTGKLPSLRIVKADSTVDINESSAFPQTGFRQLSPTEFNKPFSDPLGFGRPLDESSPLFLYDGKTAEADSFAWVVDFNKSSAKLVKYYEQKVYSKNDNSCQNFQNGFTEQQVPNLQRPPRSTPGISFTIYDDGKWFPGKPKDPVGLPLLSDCWLGGLSGSWSGGYVGHLIRAVRTIKSDGEIDLLREKRNKEVIRSIWTNFPF